MEDRDSSNPVTGRAAGSPLAAPRTRRTLLRGAAAGIAALAASRPWGGPALADEAPPSLEAARKEGPLLVFHSDQEPDVVKFLSAFTERTGIEARQQRILPGAAMPKLEAEFKTGRSDVDVYNCSDPGLLSEMQQKGQLLRYASPEHAAYAPGQQSDPPGFWCLYTVITSPIMYSTKYVDRAQAPKNWLDLLDPRWKGQIGFQNAAAGSQYAWWYLLKDVLPPDYWERLAAQKPRAYASSTQIMTEIQSGSVLIGGKVSDFQYLKAKRDGAPVEVTLPPEGVPSTSEATGILATTKRPNAAKIFIDYFLSKEGQHKFNDIQGSGSARKDVTLEGIPGMDQAKVLYPTSWADFQSREQHAKFVALWNKVTGF